MASLNREIKFRAWLKPRWEDGFGLGCMPLSRLRLEIIGNIHENPELLEGGK